MAGNFDDEHTLREVANRYFENACRCLKDDGYVQFVNFVRIQDGEVPVILSDDDGNIVTDKDAIELVMRSMAPRCIWIAQIAEAWTLMNAETYNPTMAVSQHPDRAEGIFVNVQSRQGTYMITSVFKRDEQGNPLKPIIQGESFVSHNDSTQILHGRMTNYYHDILSTTNNENNENIAWYVQK